MGLLEEAPATIQATLCPLYSHTNKMSLFSYKSLLKKSVPLLSGMYIHG